MFKRVVTIFLLLFLGLVARSQDKFIDANTKKILDSLDYRIRILQREVPKLASRRDAQYFATKRELDMSIFVREFETFIFDEDLENAKYLVESRIKVSEKRADSYAVKFYKGYSNKLTKIRGQKREYYSNLFEKEKNFRKAFNRFTKVGDEYSLLRAQRMVFLAIKVASEQGRNETLKYLNKYQKLSEALLYDYYNDVDLAEVTKSEGKFQKVFEPLVNSDSLELIFEAQKLVKQCYTYASNSLSILDTSFFAIQKNVVANAITDWYALKGQTADLDNLTGQSILVRPDTLNQPGIYRWNEKIVVIGHVKFSSKSKNVQMGEALIHADKTLNEYLRLNKLVNKNKKRKVSRTKLLPYYINNEILTFNYNSEVKGWQYMVSYDMVIDNRVMFKLKKFLPPMQVDNSLFAMN